MITIYRCGEIPEEEIFARNEALPDVSGTVAGIIADVKERKDAALLEYTERFDGVRLGPALRRNFRKCSGHPRCGLSPACLQFFYF